MVLKIGLLVVFFGVMVAVGLYCRKNSTDVAGFVLGGRAVGPWLTAFAYGTSYFSAVIFVGYAGQFGWKFGIASTWIGIGNAVLGSLLAFVIFLAYPPIIVKRIKSEEALLAKELKGYHEYQPTSRRIWGNISLVYQK